MSQVQVGFTAGWLTQEALLPRTPLPAYEPYAPGSFDRHLQQAQRQAATGGDPVAPVAAPPGPSASPTPENRSQATEDDSAPASGLREPPSPETATYSTEDAAAEDERQPSADDGHDARQKPNDAPQAALAGGVLVATEAGPRPPEDATEEFPQARPGRSASTARTDAKAPPTRALAGKQPEAANAPADAQTTESAAELKAEAGLAADAAANSDGAAAQAASGEITGTEARPEAAQAEQTTAALADRAPAASAEPIAPPANGPAADVQEVSAEPAAQPPRHEQPADELPTESNDRRAEVRPGTFTLSGPQASQPKIEAADESVSPEVTARPAGLGTPLAGGPAADNRREAPGGHGSVHSAGDAEPADPNASPAAPSHTSDAGRRNEEAAGADASDRARFVQRVARAFESAADRGGHVRLRLHPPELGSLRIELTVRNGLMNARLETETESARNMLLENLPALKERLAGHQIQVERFDIEWRGQAQGGLPQRSGDQERWQPPPPGRGRRAPGVAPVGSGQNEAAARQLSAGTSFDVVI